MKPLPPPEGKISQAHTSGIFLEKPGLLKEALKRNEKWDNVVPGTEYGEPVQVKPRVNTLEDSLLKLKEEQQGGNGPTNNMINPNDDGQLIVTNMANGAPAETTTEEESDTFEEFDKKTPEVEITLNIQKANEESPGIVKMGESKDPVVVFIRHGRTPHNNMGLFTGWEDPPLAPDGVEDAKNAGKLLKMHGFKFDVVYTSWLTRAIETACELYWNWWYLKYCGALYLCYRALMIINRFLLSFLLGYSMDELDDQWLPMVKSWRLNERMYGALTGKSKQMIANEYGEDQLKK